jgi:superfamily II DNA or RNA helicase
MRALLLLKGPGQGWWGPQHGGTHVPSSVHLATHDDASAYWREHLGGKTLPLVVHSGGREIPIRVRFDARNDHAYTTDAGGRQKTGVRVFDARRAQAMGRILSVIEYPTRRLRDWDADLFLERNVGGEHYTVVLKWHPPSKTYGFSSAHFRSIENVARLMHRRGGRKNEGPLQKSGPCSTFPQLEAPNGGGIAPPGVTTSCEAGSGRTNHSLATLDGLLKAHPPLARGVSIDLWRGDEPEALALDKALRPGERWITIHAHGDKESKGTPVLIRETKEGSGVFHVVGGAGGKLNYLKLRGVRSEAEYKKEARAKAEAHRARQAEQRRRDKEAGTYVAKRKQKEAVSTQVRAQERELIHTVARAMGWSPEDLEWQPERPMTEQAENKARLKHHAELLARAQESVEAQRQRLLADAEARDEAFGEIPLHSDDPDTLATTDLDPVAPPDRGLGYATDYGKRAQAAGATEEEVRAEAERLRAQRPEEQREGLARRKATVEGIRRELDQVRIEAPTVDRARVLPAREAVELLKASKALQQVRAQAREALRKIEQAPVPEEKAYVLEVGKRPVEDDEIRSMLADDLASIATRSFLDEVGKLGGAESLGRHVGVGAHNAVNALALAAGGASLVDRDVVDVLGVAGAAQVLARRLHADLSAEDVADALGALEQWHVGRYQEEGKRALAQAAAARQVAAEIDVGAAVDGHDLALAQEANRRRAQALAEARRALGVALGEFEANAALIVALKQGRRDAPLQVPMGTASLESAIARARAIGLGDGDYQVDEVAGQRMLSVTPAGLDRLSRPVAREDLEHARAALDIIEGRRDEPGWLPLGISDRPDLAMPVPAGVAPRLAEPFTPGNDLAQSVRDYIGGRTADGDPPADILADLLSQDLARKVPEDQRTAYFAAIDQVAPLKDAKGKPVRAEAHQEAFEALADAFVADRFGARRSPLHRQSFPVDRSAVEALHRALAHEPAGTVAYRPVGDLAPRERRALRDWFAANVAHEDPRTAELRGQLEDLAANEPEREVDDMFGRGTNPAWTAWKARRDELAEQLNASGLTWGRYVQVMGGQPQAYTAVQDLVRGRVAKAFADAYNKLAPHSPLKLGRTVVRGNLDHLDAVDPQARERRLAEQRALIDSLRDRVAGRYASGAVSDKLAAARERVEAMQQSQMGFFATEPEPAKELPLAADERHTLGAAAEHAIAGMMGVVGPNFRPGQPVALWRASMDGKYVNQQRAVKLIEHGRRVVLAQGVGSGKTVIGLGAFTHLHGQGKVKRGLFVVPSVVQGQFAGEALRYLKPGKYRWHIEPGASRESRLAAYRDANTHFAVVTHQALRDDLAHLGAKHAGIGEAEMAQRLSAMSEGERRSWARDTLGREGIGFDYLMVDEGHDLLNRRGKQSSLLAHVVDAVAHETPYYVSASADPVKNDPSEAFDILHKMDPVRYADRDAFLRRYGVDTAAAKEQLRREMLRHFYPGRIGSGVRAERREETVPVNGAQKAALEGTDRLLARARLARMRGQVDVAALRQLSPGAFAGVPAAEHEATAKRLALALGMVRDAAHRRVLNEHPQAAKLDHLTKIAGERRGRPGVVFAHSREAVRQIAERLTREGHRVVTVTGEDGAKEKDARRRAFSPEEGEPAADILVASDAAQVGLNLQRGRWLVQYDTPDTAKGHAQRNGRIDRLGQKHEVELIDLVADHPTERAARKRLAEKYALREVLTSPLEGLDDTGIAGMIRRARQERQVAAGGADLFALAA